jgi:hypothetical protein
MELNITEFIKKETNLKDGNKLQEFTERELNILIYKALKEQLILSGVSQQRELLLAYNEEVNQCMVDSQDILNESDVNDFLANNCG